jgi:guanine deaminase
MAYTIVRGGLVLDIRAGTAEAADILIEGDTIRELGAPGCAAPAGAQEIDATRRLIHPGLINGHTHSHGNLAKGMGDRWTLELLLAAAPWLGGNRGLHDIRLSAQIGAIEMVLKAAPPAMICSSSGRCRAARAWPPLPPPMPRWACAR